MQGVSVAALTLVALALSTTAYANYDKCDMRYEKVGCFADRPKPYRALPEELLNARDRSRYIFVGHKIDWKNFPNYLKGFACKCAAKTREKGFDFFGLQFYGECWSGEGDYGRHGEAAKGKCTSDAKNPCIDDDKEACVGRQLTNYVYRLKKGTDGGYSEWSGWEECSKSCGGGSSTRTRTCTNPIPEGDGKDCSELGKDKETRACKTDICPVFCEGKLDVGIALDGSSSVGKYNFDKAKIFLGNLTHFLKVSEEGTHLGIIVFSTEASVKYKFSDDQRLEKVQEAINNLDYPQGGTNTAAALSLAGQAFFQKDNTGNRDGVPDVMIVLTDGQNTGGTQELLPVLNNKNIKNVKMLAVGIGFHIIEIELKVIAHRVKDNVILVQNFDKLEQKLGAIIENSCKAH